MCVYVCDNVCATTGGVRALHVRTRKSGIERALVRAGGRARVEVDVRPELCFVRVGPRKRVRGERGLEEIVVGGQKCA